MTKVSPKEEGEKKNFAVVICDSSIQVKPAFGADTLSASWPSLDKHWFQACDFQVPTVFGVDACGDTNTTHSVER